MIESPLEALVVEKATEAGWLCRKLKWIGRRAAPDRFFAKDGRVVLIEMKRPGETVKGLQSTEAQLLKAAGVEVHTCDTHLAALRVLGVPYNARA